MKIVAITGGIASGKSTVAKLLQNMGAPTIDLDRVGHTVMEPGSIGWNNVVAYFDDILNEDKTINRRKLGEIVFQNSQERKLLNSIIHPLVMKELQLLLSYKHYQQSPLPIIVEVPLLFEENLQNKFDETWCVWVDSATQLKRLMERNNFTEKEALKRINSQMSLSEKAKLADKIIDNTISRKHLIDRLRELYI